LSKATLVSACWLDMRQQLLSLLLLLLLPAGLLVVSVPNIWQCL
jgi:hypothetical protein